MDAAVFYVNLGYSLSFRSGFSLDRQTISLEATLDLCLLFVLLIICETFLCKT